MEPIIPLISSGTKGPLGVCHLPRLWLKTVLHAAGRLPEGYKVVQPGFDHMVLEGLKIDPAAAKEFLLTKPTYLEFEEWIKNQPGSNTTPGNLAYVNTVIEGRQKGDESRQKILAANGLSDDGSITDGVMLNNLIDWKDIHDELV